jgi:metal-sulfur cluster biosynthetic enzyme
MITLEDIRERLSEVRPHGLPRDIVSGGLVRDVSLREGTVVVQLQPGPLPAPILDATVADIRRTVGALPGVTAVDVQVVRPPEQTIAAIPGVGDIIAVSSTKGGVGNPRWR